MLLLTFVAYDVCHSAHATLTNLISDTLKSIIIDKHPKMKE